MLTARLTADPDVATAAISVNQRKISALKHYKLDGFSVERLMTVLTALGTDIEIKIRRLRFRKGKI